MLRLFGVLLVGVAALNAMGFCWPKFRFVWADTMVVKATEQQIRMERAFLPAWIRTPDDLRKYYSNCCEIEGLEQSLLADFLGGAHYAVGIHYPVEVNGRKIYTSRIFYLDCCGNIIESVADRGY